MEVKKYDSYKDSGNGWLGEIPEHWEFKRMKDVLNFGTGLSITKANLKNEGIPCVNYGEIHSKYGVNLDTRIHKLKCVDEKYIEKSSKALIRKGDFVFADTSEDVEGAGNFTHLRSDEEVFAGYHTVTAKPKHRLCSTFFAFEFDSLNFRTQIRQSIKGVKVFSVTQSILKNTKVWMPPIEEQTQIANYLDQKTTQIDTLISNKEKLIELLKEEQTAIINQAVTKGLDPNVPMKDSGIEWLGEIPEHWEVLSFRFCIDVLTDYTANGSFASLAKNVNYLDVGYSRLVRLTDLRVDLKNDGLFVDENAHNFLKKSELYGGEMLIANVGAYAGLVKIMPHLEGKHTLGPNMFLLRLNQNTDFFYEQLNAPFCAEQLKMMAISSAQPKLNKDNMRQLKVVKPPLEEQEVLVEKIKSETGRIDGLASKIGEEIDLLKEYKTALISEVVTGKVDVRDIKLN